MSNSRMGHLMNYTQSLRKRVVKLERVISLSSCFSLVRLGVNVSRRRPEIGRFRTPQKQEIKIPSQCWGGWRGIPREPSSTSFPRECGRTGHHGRPDLGRSRLKRDLQPHSCGTVSE